MIFINRINLMHILEEAHKNSWTVIIEPCGQIDVHESIDGELFAEYHLQDTFAQRDNDDKEVA